MFYVNYKDYHIILIKEIRIFFNIITTKRIMKKLTFALLLLFSCLNVWAVDLYTYPASAEDPSTGLTVEFNGDKATVTLYKSGALANNLWGPQGVRNLGWPNVKLINFVSEDDGAVYSSDDWAAVKAILNPQFSTPGDLSLDFSAMIINDSDFKIGASNANYIKMPNGLKDLAADAFKDSYYLSAIGWSPNLKTIGQEAFFETNFKTITVPEGVTSIGPGAFARCGSLDTVTLPTSLKEVGALILEGTHVKAIHSHNPTAPTALGDICDNTGWDTSKGEFNFYGDCVLYIKPDSETFNSYLNSPIWCKFFISGSAKICLHTYDTNRPLVEDVQKLTVNQTNVHSEIGAIIGDFERIFHVNTVYFRDMTTLKWYTIMLPFDVETNIVKSVFGEGTKIMGYSGIHDYTLCFEEATDKIEANVPYLIKPGNTESDYEFDGSTISYSKISESTTEFSALGANTSYNQYDSEFVGTYCNKQIPVYAYYLKSDKFYYMPSENTKKGWKAYGGVVMINASAVEGRSVAARPSANYFEINIDDMPTGIDAPTSVAIGTQSLDGPIYTLSGQQVKNPGKGIYIRNGKKYLIKVCSKN